MSLLSSDPLPSCPRCGGTSFAKASMFTDATTSQQPLLEPDTPISDWLDEARSKLTKPGQYIAYEDGERVVVVALTREWIRIGRSLAADVRFDDPTVSRRHALVVRRADGVRVLDDRSLNGVYVNGERVDWSTLRDGDEIYVGRHRLHFLEVTAVAGKGDDHAPNDAQSVAQ